MKIIYKNKVYNVNIRKIAAFVSLFDKKISIKEENIEEVLKKYHLLDEIFLENINKI